MASMSEVSQVAIRQRTFLKGTLYFDNRRASIECVVRDMSESGARLTFEHPVTVPDNVELFIPHKQQTLRARVERRGSNEVGIAFEVERSLEPRRNSDAELQQRIATLETEVSALKRLVAKLKAKVMPHDLDAA
jgi:PilZ domain